MSYNKTDRDCRYQSLLEIVSPQWELLPSAFGVGQYFPNFGETISNSDLNTSHCLYNVSRILLHCCSWIQNWEDHKTLHAGTNQAINSACWWTSKAVKPGAVFITLNDSFIRMSHRRTSPLMLKQTRMHDKLHRRSFTNVKHHSENRTTCCCRLRGPKSIHLGNGLPLLALRHLVSLPVSTPLHIVNRCWSCSCKWRYINVDL